MLSQQTGRATLGCRTVALLPVVADAAVTIGDPAPPWVAHQATSNDGLGFVFFMRTAITSPLLPDGHISPLPLKTM